MECSKQSFLLVIRCHAWSTTYQGTYSLIFLMMMYAPFTFFYHQLVVHFQCCSVCVCVCVCVCVLIKMVPIIIGKCFTEVDHTPPHREFVLKTRTYNVKLIQQLNRLYYYYYYYYSIILNSDLVWTRVVVICVFTLTGRDTKIQLIKINFAGDTSNAKLLQLYGCPLLISF